MRIAVLDNDHNQAELVCQVLASDGHSSHLFDTGKALLAQLRRESYDMLIIHWHVTDVRGTEILNWVRERLPRNLPVMFIANRSAEDDVVEALEAGANDYLIRPVRRGELAVRVQALLRLAYPNQNAVERIQFSHYVFEKRTNRLSIHGNPVRLTQKEFALAFLFFQNIGRPLSRAYILEAIWERDIDMPSRTMDTHVSRVRSKLRLHPENGFRLAPVYSYGYRLEQVT